MKILILSPHLDDELYSCSSILQNSKHFIDVVFLTTNKPREAIYEKYIHKDFSHVSFIYDTFNIKDAESERSNLKDIVTILDSLITKYDIIVFPEPSFNKDHVVLHEATDAALRHLGNTSIKLVLTYAYQYIKDREPYNFYLNVDANRKQKYLDILNKHCNIYTNKLSEPEGYRSLDKLNGCHSGYSSAEAFKVYYSQGLI